MALTDQMMRAARLETALYEEVEADTTQTQNALIVVVLASLASGIGTAIATAGTVVPPAASGGASPVGGLIGGVIAALAGWAIWTGFVYLVGTRMLGGTATWGEVLRTVGFANSPGVLNILGFIPAAGGLIRFVVGIWIIVATVIAVRQALDVGTGRAIASAIIGGILAAIVHVLILAAFAIPAGIMGAFGS